MRSVSSNESKRDGRVRVVGSRATGNVSPMAIRTIELFHVALPLKTRVTHASHERTISDNLVVRVTLEGGQVGHGEGVPRPYVTGETIETTFATLSSFDFGRHFGRPDSYEAVVRRLEALELPETEADPRGMAGNAARCALELAILDAYGHRFGQSRRGRDPAGRRARARTWREAEPRPLQRGDHGRVGIARMGLGLEDVALRLPPGQAEGRRRRSGRPRAACVLCDRSSAGGWTSGSMPTRPGRREVVERVRPLLPFEPSALEQPVPHAEVEALAELRPRLGVPVMLDESLCGYPDAVRAIERGTADLFNVRLSKCGGIIPSLRIIALAQRRGPGRAARLPSGRDGPALGGGPARREQRPWAALRRGLVRPAHPGRNLTVEDLTFGYGGWAPALTGPGLGVRVDPEALERMTRIGGRFAMTEPTAMETQTRVRRLPDPRRRLAGSRALSAAGSWCSTAFRVTAAGITAWAGRWPRRVTRPISPTAAVRGPTAMTAATRPRRGG